MWDNIMCHCSYIVSMLLRHVYTFIIIRKAHFRLYFFFAAQIARVAQLILFKGAVQLRQSG